MQAREAAQPQARVYPLVLLMDRGGWVVFTPYRIYHKPPLRGGSFLAAVSPLEKFGLPRLRARGIHGRVA